MNEIEILVVDASPFINSTIDLNFQNLVTTNQVVNELKDKKVRQLLQQHSIKTREPSEEALKFVVQFSKMTGDYNSLSRADLGIIALTLTYEWEMVGKSHLRREPKSKIAESSKESDLQSNGKNIQNEDCVGISTETKLKKKKKRSRPKKAAENKVDEDVDTTMQQEDGNIMQLDDDEDEETKVEIVHIKEVESTKPSKLTSFIGNETIMDIPVPENELSDSDGGDWITPSSIRPKTASTVQKQKIKVACITNDFAMQNVILQMGLQLFSPQGTRITKLKTWVMRCHACFKINLKNETVFCNYCGNNSLIRTSVSVNGDGTLKVYLKHDFQYNNRGTIYSIPEPKGGRKCNDMVLRADQKEYVRALEVKKRNDRKENIDFDGDLLFGAKRDNVMPVIGYGKRNINQVTTGRRRK